MLIKAKARKRLGAGVHPVVIKDISIAKNPETQAPLTEKDPVTGEDAVAFDVLFMSGDVGITERFWLFDKNQWIIDSLMEAIGLDNAGEVPVTDAIGRKLFIAVAKVLLYDNLKPRYDGGSGEQVWYPALLPKFFKCIDPKMPPRIPGDPQWSSDGQPSKEFLKHRDSEHGDFFPQQDWYAGDTDDEEAFGT